MSHDQLAKNLMDQGQLAKNGNLPPHYDAKVLAAAEFLLPNLHMLKEKDKAFAASLLESFSKGVATAKQCHWIEVMAGRAKNGGKDIEVPDAAKFNMGGFKSVLAMLFTAKSNGLKYPKLNLKLPMYEDGEQVGDGKYATKKYGGGNLQISLAGKNSKYAGSAMLTDGEPFGMNRWFGVIDSGGVFKPGKSYYGEPDYVQKDILDLLKHLAASPTEVAHSHGALTGNCCFCGLGLTDPKSVAVGYGPVCANHWGLPWGNEAILGDGGLSKEMLDAMTGEKSLLPKHANGDAKYTNKSEKLVFKNGQFEVFGKPVGKDAKVKFLDKPIMLAPGQYKIGGKTSTPKEATAYAEHLKLKKELTNEQIAKLLQSPPSVEPVEPVPMKPLPEFGVKLPESITPAPKKKTEYLF